MKDVGVRIQTDDGDNEIAIKVEHVSKTFRLPHNRQNSIKGSLINLVKGGDRTYEKQEVLKDVSFEIKKGEFFGIVGRNGSGKSTLLKMLAGIYKPTKGKITVSGSLTPFIELGVGFNPELTGRENVFLNGALLGFNRDDMNAMYDDIVAFAELERFMDQKLKNYSSGMQVRLAFSIAIRARSDILLIDEVLAVGDVDFQQKCYQYFDELKESKRTIILVSHDMSAVKQFCDRAILISNGKIVHQGKPSEVALDYERLNLNKSLVSNSSHKQETLQDNQVKIVISREAKTITSIENGTHFDVNISWDKDLKVENVGILIFKGQELVFATNSKNVHTIAADNYCSAKLTANLGNGRYTIKVGLFAPGSPHKAFGIFGNRTLTVFGAPSISNEGDEVEGITILPVKWELKEL